ncbi:MAG: hypothetical protein IPQ07_11035 [Myxococcales bacterium]|nr:hypothetical protein [Myxococcales bacterium]
MMVTIADLGQAVHDLTSIHPEFEFSEDKPGKRSCPHCAQTMSACKLRVLLDGAAEAPKPELDRCTTHGLWFDDGELAKVFEKVASKGFGGGVGRKAKDFSAGETGDGGRWSAMFKGRSGGWGGW